jgi:DNA segregation ATPase FtsK/SpoIIIE-like protein
VRYHSAVDGRIALYDVAIALVIRDRQTSTTQLQRDLYGEGFTVGYNRCALFMAQMELEGIVGRLDNARKREVLRRVN